MSALTGIADYADPAANSATAVTNERRLSPIRPIVRRGFSRREAATYIGISSSKFDELRKANRIAPPKVLDGRLIFTVERLDEFLDLLPDENQTSNDDWTTSL